MTNKDRANKIKKLLSLQGKDNDTEYYRVADVLCDIKHYCDHYKVNWEQENTMAETHYNSETS